jgi:hypothetical protein
LTAVVHRLGMLGAIHQVSDFYVMYPVLIQGLIAFFLPELHIACDEEIAENAVSVTGTRQSKEKKYP